MIVYDFSGIYHRIWSVSGKLVVLVIICILLGKPWKKKFLIKNHLWEFFAIIIAIGYAIIMLSRIYFPDIASYTGKFCYYNNASKIISNNREYTFENNEGRKQIFYLDVSSRVRIFPNGFEDGKMYTIYFDNFTKTIVKVKTSS